MKEINLKITVDGISIKSVNKEGVTEYKRCEKEELLRLIETSLSREEEIYNNTGILHKNIIEISTAINPGNGSVTRDYFLYVSKGPLPFNYFNKIYIFEEFPALLFRFKVDNSNKIQSASVFVIKEERDSFNNDTLLYKYPFGNVWADGRICWGGNNLPLINESRDLLKAVDLFFQFPTGDDLYSGKNVRFNGPQSKLLKKLTSNKININDILIEYGSFLSYKEMQRTSY